MSAALVIQYAKRLRRIVVCGLAGSRIFFHIITKMARSSGGGGWGAAGVGVAVGVGVVGLWLWGGVGGNVAKHKMFVMIFSTKHI